jgi:membrane protein
MRRAWRFLRTLSREFSENALTDVAAQLAYWSELALVPLLMFMLSLAGYLPLQNAADTLLETLYHILPPAAAQVIEGVVKEVVGRQHGWLLVASLGVALWSAAGGTAALMTALNRAYSVRETRPWWRVRLTAVLFTLSAVVLCMIAVVSLAVGPELVHAVWAHFGLGGAFDQLWSWLRWPIVCLAMMLMLANCYYFLPNVTTRRWRFITPGSVTAVVLWVGASLGFRLYLQHFDSYAKTYGSLGALIILLTWIYLSSLMVILGGEVNAILDRQAKKLKHHVKEPGPTTVPDPYVTT